MSGPAPRVPAAERYSARVGAGDWAVFLNMAARAGVPTAAYTAAAIGWLAVPGHRPGPLLAVSLDGQGPLVPRAVAPPLRPDVAERFQEIIGEHGLTTSAAVARVVHAVAAGVLVVSVDASAGDLRDPGPVPSPE